MIRETNQCMEIHDQELVIVADSVVQDYDGNSRTYTAELDLSDCRNYLITCSWNWRATNERGNLSNFHTDEATAVVDLAIIQAVHALHLHLAEHLTMQDLLLRKCWRIRWYTSWTWYLLWGATALLQQETTLHLISQSAGNSDSCRVLVKANEMGIRADWCDKRTRPNSSSWS